MEQEQRAKGKVCTKMRAPNSVRKELQLRQSQTRYFYPFVNVLLTSLLWNRIRMKAGQLPGVVLALCCPFCLLAVPG